ncbi:hypothetical protein BZA05DRAFT_343349 [Tricharina praecox]|uniref:uncharacterized protein n=1 Tax=Tricharina praecox TaxID=43433 RepID=UPI00221FEB43|nr:uncharacterized protein BZA05DRAFT_343349 [Tricharina praecox]KAI5844160.1 hypothetical protein BZA05DRAFT_343349 [Tricharina praecox]
MPAHSQYPPIPVPKEDLYRFIFDRKDRPFPDSQVIFVDGNTNREMTFADLRDQSKAFGIGLKSIWEWKKGDVLAVFSTNQIDTPPLMLGALWASGTVTPANPNYTVDELTFQLKDSRAKAIATLPELLPIVTKAAANVGIPTDRILILGDQRAAGFKHWREIIDPSTAVKWRQGKIDANKDLAFLVYSSGTTGHPKGVMLCHRNIGSNVLQLLAGEGPNLTWEKDTIIAFLPFFHIYGLTCLILQNCYSGKKTVVMDRFDLDKFCSLIQQHKITMGYIVPPVVLALAKSPVATKYDLTSLRMLNSGAAPLTRELVDAVWDRLKVPVKQGYGLSETSPVTHTQQWHLWQSTIGSVGHMLPNMSCKYCDEEGNELPIGETGELWLKGPNVMLGYLNNPTATANAITPDGYFKTGDVGHEDKHGNVFITDRVKELIKYKGFQVPPAELEGKLMGHEKVDDVAVIGVYDEALASEVPRAYIVPKAGTNSDEKALAEEISQYLSERVAHHKRLRGGIRFVEAIPKSVSGKILRRILKEHAKAEAATGTPIKAKL